MKKLLLALLLVPVLVIGQERADKSAVIDVTAAATDILVTRSPDQISAIYVTGFSISGDTLATVAEFKYGTGTTCGTGTISLTGAMRMCDECNITYGNGIGVIFRVPPGNDLCLTATTGAVLGIVTYSQRNP